MLPAHNLFPWAQMLRITYGQLGIEPDIFWKMTPCEWMLAAQQHSKSETASIVRSDLLEMITAFPD